VNSPWCTLVVLAKPDGAGGHARRAQLDALERSVDRHWRAPTVVLVDAPHGERFSDAVDEALLDANPYVCFACDDGLFVRPVDLLPALVLENNREVLTFSLRYGRNTVTSYPNGRRLGPWPGPVWPWQGMRDDYGYPGSVDGHVFRRDDLLELLEHETPGNPTALEVHLDVGCRSRLARRPLMASYSESCYVGVPVNRVSEQSHVRAGDTHPQPADELNARFDNGERIDLDAIDLELIDGPHAEVLFQWTR
jgi:hypothetical protein